MEQDGKLLLPTYMNALSVSESFEIRIQPISWVRFAKTIRTHGTVGFWTYL